MTDNPLGEVVVDLIVVQPVQLAFAAEMRFQISSGSFVAVISRMVMYIAECVEVRREDRRKSAVRDK